MHFFFLSSFHRLSRFSVLKLEYEAYEPMAVKQMRSEDEHAHVLEMRTEALVDRD